VTDNRLVDAERHYEAGIELNERMGARPWAAHTRHDLAKLLLARDRPGDGERAEDLLADALATARELGMVALEAKLAFIGSGRPRPGAPAQARAAGAPPRSVFRREGEYWSIAFDGQAFRLHDSKGLRYLAALLAAPGREVHVMDLVGGEEGADSVRMAIGDAGEALDSQARAAYHSRLKDPGGSRGS
jgi:hypothetical protein